jgi:hypothetical protein
VVTKASDQHFASSFSEEVTYIFSGIWVGHRAHLDDLKNRKILLPLPGIEPLFNNFEMVH